MRPRVERWTTGGLGSETVQNLVRRVDRLEHVAQARLSSHGGLLKSLMPGIKARSATDMVTRIITASRAFAKEFRDPRTGVKGLDVYYSLKDNAVFRAHFHDQHGKIARSLDFPLDLGVLTHGTAKEAGVVGAEVGEAAAVTWRQPRFAARGFLEAQAGGEYRALRAGMKVTEAVESELAEIGVYGIGDRLKQLQATVAHIHRGRIYSGAMAPGTALAPVTSPLAIIQASEMQVMSEAGVPLAESLKKKYTFGLSKTGKFTPEKSYAHMLAMRQHEFTAGGVTLRDLALKPETGMESFVTGFTHGHYVPFGMHEDPTRQTYQRAALWPLARRPKRPVSTTTPWFEATRKAVSPRFADPEAFRLPTTVLFTGDPRFERGAGLSAGGMVLTSETAKGLEYKAYGQTRLMRTGAAVIAGTGGKYTVQTPGVGITGGIGAIAHIGTIEKGKYPGAIRQLIVDDIMAQVGAVPRAGPTGKAKLAFLGRLAGEVGGTLSRAGTGMQMSVGPESTIDARKLERIQGLIRDYNRLMPAAHLRTEIAQVTETMTGPGGEIPGVTGLRIKTWLGPRVGQELDVIGSAVGRGPQVPGIGDIGLYYTPRFGKGMKIRLKDIEHIAMYGVPESEALAEIFTQAIEFGNLGAKQDILKTGVPLFGANTLAGGIKLESIAASAPFKPLGHPEGKFYEFAHIQGTIFDPTHPYYKGPEGLFRGLTIDLPEGMKVPGLQGSVYTKQIHIPSPFSMGFAETAEIVEGGGKVSAYYMSSAQRAAYDVHQAAIKNPAAFRDTYLRAIKDVTKASLGKGKMLRTLIEPRMGQSGIFRLGGAGTGPVARALGTELTATTLATGEIVHEAAQVLISEADVRAMGGAKLVREFMTTGVAPKGQMFGLVQAWPAQSFAHTRAVMYKMVSESEKRALGPGMLGVGGALAGILLRDRDADTLGALIISGRRGQERLKEFAFMKSLGAGKGSIAEIGAVAKALEELIPAEKYAGPGSILYRELLKGTDDTISAAAHMAEYMTKERVEQYFGTKLAVPVVDTWRRRMSIFLATEATHGEQRGASAIMSAIMDRAAMLKGKEVGERAAEVVGFAGSLTKEALTDTVQFAAATKDYINKAKAVYEEFAGVGKFAGKGGTGVIASGVDIELGAMAMARIAKSQRMAGASAFPRMGYDWALTTTKIDDPIRAFTEMIGAADEGMIKSAGDRQKAMARLIGFEQLEKSFAEGAGPHVKQPMVAAVNRALTEAGAAGEKLPPALLDRIIDWFRTPGGYYKKSAVIGGTALLGGAVVKNLLFPGFTPADEAGFSPVHTAVPIPVRMPGMERAQMDSIFSRAETHMPMDSTFSMPPNYVNMGSRTPLPAVQMGAGTMQPGAMPSLAGGLFREPAPAPTVLNQEQYNRMAPGSPAPPAVRLAEPRETVPLRKSWSVEADLPGAGFDRRLLEDIQEAEIRIMTEPDETELGIRMALAENEYSQFS